MKKFEFYTKEEVEEMKQNYQPFEGYKCGLENFDKLYRIDIQTLTTLVAVPSNGKSTFVNFYSYLMNKTHGWKTLFWVAETPTNKQYHYMTTHYQGDTKKTAENVLITKTKLDTWEDIKDMIRYAATVHKVKLIVLDNFTCLKRFFNESIDFSTIDKKISELVDLAKETETAILLIAHPKMLTKNDYKIDGYSVKGSTGFYDMSDYMFTLSADKKKKITTIDVLKIRDDDKGTEGKCYLKFNPIDKSYSDMTDKEINDIDDVPF